MNTIFNLSRRSFFKTSALAGGGEERVQAAAVVARHAVPGARVAGDQGVGLRVLRPREPHRVPLDHGVPLAPALYLQADTGAAAAGAASVGRPSSTSLDQTCSEILRTPTW